MRKTISIVLTLIILLTAGIQGYAAEQASISAKTDKQYYNLDDTVRVEIEISNVKDLYGIQLDMSYDPSYLDLNEDGIVDIAWAGEDGFTTSNKEVSSVRYIATKLGDTDSINGNTKLLAFEFTAKKLGDTTVSITNIMASDSNGELIDVNSSTSVKVSIKEDEDVVVDKSELQNLVNQVKGSYIDAGIKDKYTENTWANLMAAYNKAVEALNDDSATQEDIDLALANLKAALDNLKLKEDPGEDPGKDPGEDPGKDPGKDPDKDPGQEPGDEPDKEPEEPGKDPSEDPYKKPDKTVDDDADKDKTKSPKTGDDSAKSLYIFVSAALASGIILLKRKRILDIITK